jgi:hypothetical protein
MCYGTHFTTPGSTSEAAANIKAAIDAAELVWAHALEYACASCDIAAPSQTTVAADRSRDSGHAGSSRKWSDRASYH